MNNEGTRRRASWSSHDVICPAPIEQIFHDNKITTKVLFGNDFIFILETIFVLLSGPFVAKSLISSLDAQFPKIFVLAFFDWRRRKGYPKFGIRNPPHN